MNFYTDFSIFKLTHDEPLHDLVFDFSQYFWYLCWLSPFYFHWSQKCMRIMLRWRDRESCKVVIKISFERPTTGRVWNIFGTCLVNYLYLVKSNCLHQSLMIMMKYNANNAVLYIHRSSMDCLLISRSQSREVLEHFQYDLKIYFLCAFLQVLVLSKSAMHRQYAALKLKILNTFESASFHTHFTSISSHTFIKQNITTTGE